MGDSGLAKVIGCRVVLPPGLLARFPELAAVHWRRDGVPVRVAGWFLGRRSAAAITLWNIVFLAPDVPFEPELLLHELRHVQQFGASVAFPVRYLWESVRHGYFANRYEADARAYASWRLRGDG
jgi:hypothetical protein